MSRLIDRLGRPRATQIGVGSTYTFYSETFPKDGAVEGFNDFSSYVADAYRANGVVFAAITARQMLLSEGRFKYRNFTTKETFGTPDLALLEKPWPNGTTGKLISHMEQDASLAGNAYVWKRPGKGRLRRLSPGAMKIILDPKAGDEDLVLGYLYKEGDKDEQFIPAGEMAHYAPIPDPEAPHRGVSWITPVALEVLSDKRMTLHKHKYFTNAATPAMVIKHEKKFNPDTKEAIRAELASRYEGTENAYKSLLLDGGADLQIVGANLKDLDFSGVQGGGENRIAVASGVPAVVLGIKEGLGGSSLNAGNYGEAMRRFTDITCRPLWREMAGTLEPFVTVPTGAELWYDLTDVAALRQDEDKQAGIEATKASTIRQLIDGGFEPDSVVQAVVSGDFTDLVHTGLAPVQVQPEETAATPEEVEEPEEEEAEEGEES